MEDVISKKVNIYYNHMRIQPFQRLSKINSFFVHKMLLLNSAIY